MLLFSDESELYSGFNSGLITTFDINSQKTKNSYSGHSSPITSLSIYRQNNTNCVLASADAQGKIKLWDLKSKNPAVNYKGHFASISDVKFSPDMTCLASGDEDGYVKIWDLRNGKILKEINNFNKAVISLEFNPNEIGLAFSCKDKIVRYYNLKNYEIVTETNPDKLQIEKIVFDKKNFIFSATNDALKYYEMTAHKMLLHNTFETGWKKLQSLLYVSEKYVSGLSVLNNKISFFYLRYYDMFKGKKMNASYMSNIDEDDDENIIDKSNDDVDDFGLKENNFVVVNNAKKSKKNKKLRANSVKSKIDNGNKNKDLEFVYSNKILKDILNDDDDSFDFEKNENKKNDGLSLGISKFINSNMTDATVSPFQQNEKKENEKKEESVFMKNAKNILGLQNNNYTKNLEKFIKKNNKNNNNKNNNKNNNNNNDNLLPLNISNITLTTQKTYDENNNDDFLDFVPDKNTSDLIKNLSNQTKANTNSNNSNNNNNNISEEKNLADFLNSDKSKEIDSISMIDNMGEIDDPFLEDPIFTSTKRSKNTNNTLNESNFTLNDFNSTVNNNNNNSLNNTNTTFKTINSNETLGLDIDNFMNNSKLTISSTTTANQMNFNQTIHEIPKSKDLPILTEINSQHDKIRKEITKRKNHLMNIISAWNDSDMYSVIKSIQRAHDLGVVNDFFTYAFVGRNDIQKIPISIEQSLILLPYVKNLINNQYNAYNITGCKTGMIFIKILFEIVVTTKQNLNNNLKGLDVFEKLDSDLEDKVSKCDEVIKIFKEMEENKKLKKLCNENKNVVVAEAAKNFLSELEFFLQPFKYQNYNESSNKIHIRPEF